MYRWAEGNDFDLMMEASSSLVAIMSISVSVVRELNESSYKLSQRTDFRSAFKEFALLLGAQVSLLIDPTLSSSIIVNILS